MADMLVCWKCGASLRDLPVPFGRREECPACRADLHVCRMCRHYAPGVAKACREPMADEVKDKERASFCDWFQARADAFATADDRSARASRAGLEALFGIPSSDTDRAPAADEPGRSASEAAREALDRLFGPGRSGGKPG